MWGQKLGDWFRKASGQGESVKFSIEKWQLKGWRFSMVGLGGEPEKGFEMWQ